MQQLTIDFDTSGIIANSVFTSTLVEDKLSQSTVSAIQIRQNWPEVSINLTLNIIHNSTFASLGYLYLDTISSKNLVAPSKLNYANGDNLELDCYMNMSSDIVIKDIHKNLKTILVAYFINSLLFHTIPNADDNLPDWVKFDPSVNMFFIKSDFVLDIERNFQNTPTCYYRTSYYAEYKSILYKYANKANSNVCSHEFLEAESVKLGIVSRCPHGNREDVLACSFYKEDKFNLFTTELYSKHNSEKVIKQINCYMIREIITESYLLLFEEIDLTTNKKSLLKRFSYGNILVNQLDQREQLIAEALKQNTIVIADYVSDYNYKLKVYIQSAEDLKQKKRNETKVSFLSRLIPQ